MTISRSVPFKQSADTTGHLRSSQWLGAMSLAGLLLGASAHAAEPAQPVAVSQRLEQAFDFDIPAQSLSGALIAFGQQAGIQVSADSALLRGRDSVGVSGQLPARTALIDLLHGSGVRWSLDPAANTLTLEEIPVTDAYLQSTQQVLVTDNIVVLGTPEETSFQGETVIDRRAIEAFPGANGDITTLLQMHPSVRFNGNEKSSKTGGEIDPADISINGAKYYQNNFMIDGVSINNDLDPGAHDWSDYNTHESLPSRSHGIALDADMLESVKVYDSNISAEFGGFNGGVVDAITRRPTERLSGKVSTSMTRSEWTKFHIRGDQVEGFEDSTDAQNQPEFEKITYRGRVEGYMTDTFGAIVNISRKTSVIPLKAYDNDFQSPGDNSEKDQSRQIDNFTFNGFWTPNERLDFRFTLMHAPQENEYFRANVRNSDTKVIQGGSQASIKAVWLGDDATYTHKFAHTKLDTSRESDSSELKTWRWSQEKNWGNPNRTGATSIEGGLGDLNQSQESTTYGLKAEWLPMSAFGTTHNFLTGFELGQTTATYERTTDYITATTSGLTPFTGAQTCNFVGGGLDSEYCSISVNASNASERQFLRNLNYFRAGKIEITERKYALYAQDTIEIGKLTLRPGVRLDADDYMEKKSLAPRFAMEYDVFADKTTVLAGGLNRYYGRNLFAYRLMDGRESLRWRRVRGTSNAAQVPVFGPWTNYGVDAVSFRTLDIPYDDELMLGLTQMWLDTKFEFKYVHREGRDQVVRSTARALGLQLGNNVDSVTNYATYTNAGETISDNYSLVITPQWEITGLGSSTSLQAAFDWSKTKTNNSTYQQSFSVAQVQDKDVMFDGKLTAYSELPASEFNRPWTARLTTITEVPNLHLTWSNFFRYRGPYQQIVSKGATTVVAGETYAVYETADVKSAPSWDTSLKWEVPTAKDQSFFVAVDVNNVMDTVSPIVSASGTTTYEAGRQYWLEVGYNF